MHGRREAKWPCPLGEAAKTYPHLSLPRWSKKLSCRFASQAWHFVTFDVFHAHGRREAKMAVSFGEAAKTCLFQGDQTCSSGRRGAL